MCNILIQYHIHISAYAHQQTHVYVCDVNDVCDISTDRWEPQGGGPACHLRTNSSRSRDVFRMGDRDAFTYMERSPSVVSHIQHNRLYVTWCIDHYTFTYEVLHIAHDQDWDASSAHDGPGSGRPTNPPRDSGAVVREAPGHHTDVCAAQARGSAMCMLASHIHTSHPLHCIHRQSCMHAATDTHTSRPLHQCMTIHNRSFNSD